MPNASPTRAAAARRACLALFSALAAFAALQIAISAAVNIRFSEGMDTTYGCRIRRLREAVASAPAPPRTVVMIGTSRTFVGLDSVGLGEGLSQQLGRPIRVANFGVKGAGLVDELIAWRRLRRDGVRPDLLLVEVLPAYLGDAIPIVETLRVPASGLDWFDVPLLKRYQAGGRKNLWVEVGLVEVNSLYNRRSAILNAAMPRMLPVVEEPAPTFINDDAPAEFRIRATEGARQIFGGLLPHLHLGGYGCDALRELLRSCREAGVPAAVVVMPEGPMCRSWYPPGSGPTIRQWLEQECREQKAGFVNAWEWMDEDEFLDSHHLLHRGAKRFTERLGREYVGPMLRGASDGSGVSHE